MAGARARRARCGRRRVDGHGPARQGQGPPRSCRARTATALSPAAPAAPAGPGTCSGESGTRPGTRRVPAPEDPGASPGGVELVMSPGLALCEAGSQESSAGGLCRAGLARREAGWTASRWARITQAGSDPHRPRPVPGSACAARKSAGFWSWRRGRLFGGGFEDVEREGCGDGPLGRVLLVRRVVARASECVSRVRLPSASPGCDESGH